MAFKLSGFRGVGGYNREFEGGQMFSYVNIEDTIPDMKVEGYFNPKAKALHEGDIIWVTGINTAGTDNITDYIQVIRPAEPVTVSSGVPIAPDTGITAGVGGGLVNAIQLISHANFVDIIATTGDSVVLPTASVAQRLEVFNRTLGASATSLDIFSQSGDTINEALTVIAVAGNGARVFTSDGATNWQTH